MTPELTPPNETTNNRDDSAADGIEGDHAGEIICGKEIRRIVSGHAATVLGQATHVCAGVRNVA